MESPDTVHEDTKIRKTPEPGTSEFKTPNLGTSPEPSLSSAWTQLALKYRDSVVQLRCTEGVYDVYRPYQTPRDRQASGTGFVVDAEKGYVLTNAHVVANAINITGRLMVTGKVDLPMRLLTISRERDLALCCFE